VVICTDGRVASLRETLQSLRQLIFQNFEVCVVYGPTLDGTRELLERWPDPIKIAPCLVRNLSVSRNIGIGLASGDILAFLDDDAIPEPEWLHQIVAAYTDDTVGGAGGFVLDYTGFSYQYRFGTADRLGRANLSWTRPAPELNFPLSTNFPHLLGANSSFRRSALLSVGGFDEEFEYYLDETDLAARIVDDGWRIVQIDGGYVHHKFMASALRNEKRVLKSWYAVVKNKIYYCLVHRHGQHNFTEIIQEVTSFVDGFRRDVERAVGVGYLTEDDRSRFAGEIEQAWSDGLRRGLLEQRRLMSREMLAATPPPFESFLQHRSVIDRKTFCLMSQQYPPNSIGGVGRYIHQLSVGLAKLGHQVHVLTTGADHNRVDLEDGVWVHRIVIQEAGWEPAQTAAGPIPQRIWGYSNSMLAEIESINARRPVDCVYAPIWDCEGAAVLRSGRFPLVVGLQTTFKFWMDSHLELYGDREFVTGFLQPLLELETQLLTESPALHAISAAIVQDIEAAYGVQIRDRTTVIQLGLADYSAKQSSNGSTVRGEEFRILFVGRLEMRKGIDVLLKIAPEILDGFGHVQIDIVGNDTIAADNGMTFRQQFEAIDLPEGIKRRIHFHGEVSEETLCKFYRDCDVFVAPSRFESFGLIFVEAMMFGKPVVGCRAGGMPEVILDKETGLLAEPGDDKSLYDCLVSLICDEELRQSLGAAGRKRYEELFTVDRMAKSVAELLSGVEGIQAFKRKSSAKPDLNDLPA